MGVNVTDDNGPSRGRRRIEGPEVGLPMSVSSSPLAAMAVEGPAPVPAPAEDRLGELPLLTRRAIARLVVAVSDLSGADAVWCSTFLTATAGNEGLPAGPREVIERSCGVLTALMCERPRPAMGVPRGLGTVHD